MHVFVFKKGEVIPQCESLILAATENKRVERIQDSSLNSLCELTLLCGAVLVQSERFEPTLHIPSSSMSSSSMRIQKLAAVFQTC